MQTSSVVCYKVNWHIWLYQSTITLNRLFTEDVPNAVDVLYSISNLSPEFFLVKLHLLSQKEHQNKKQPHINK